MSLYHEALAVDSAFQEALEAEYGSRAGDMRYQPKAWPNHIRKLHQEKLRMDKAWLESMRPRYAKSPMF